MKTTQERVKTYLESSTKELEKLGLVLRPIIYFPKRQSVPLLSKLAMWILKKQGSIMDIQFIDKLWQNQNSK